MRYDADHKQKTRERVVKAAAKAIRGNGPQRVGVAGVMSKAGLTHGGFYAHFASKDALIAAAIERMFDEAQLRWTRETEDRAPSEALASYIDFYLSTAHRDARGSGCPLAALAADLPRLPLTCRDSFARGAERLRDTFAAMLRQLDHADAEGEALSLSSELVGALSLARCETDRALSDALLEMSRRRLKERLGVGTAQPT